MAVTNAIEIKDLHKQFGSVKAIDGATFNVPTAKIFGFLGPNGAGKTTTIQCLMDFISPTSGEVRVFGKNVHDNGVELRKHIGYLPSNTGLYDHWTGEEHIEFMAGLKGAAAQSELTKRLDFETGKKVKHLSTGNRQKLGIIMAFIGEPKLVIMDEPTRGLDPILQNELYEILAQYRAAGGTVFMSSHNLPEVEKVCDSIAVIRQGKIVVEETLQSLRSKNIHHVVAIFDKAVRPEQFKLTDVDILHHSGHAVTLRVKGNIDQLLHIILQQKVKDLEITHASLEEVFLEANK